MKLWLQLHNAASISAVASLLSGQDCQPWPLGAIPPWGGLLLLDQVPASALGRPWVLVGEDIASAASQAAYRLGAVSLVDFAWPVQPLQAMLAAWGSDVTGGAALAHDLNNLLFAAQLNLHLAQGWAKPPAGKPDHLSRLAWALGQMEVQLKNTMLQARGALTPQPPFQPDPLLGFALQTLQAQVPDNVTLEADLQAGSAWLGGPQELFLNLLWNLLLNGLEALTPAGGKLALQSLVREGGYVLRIQDNGPGLPPERAQHPFVPGPSPKGAGRGWWLAQAKEAAMAKHCLCHP